ncbi:MAG: ORF6N domain-containing protein [Acidobacteriota bacterium]
MAEVVKVGEREILPVEYQGQRVLTLRQVDELHGKQDDSAGRRFRAHRDEFVFGEDYFEVRYDEWASAPALSSLVRTGTLDQRGGHRGHLILLAETGYLLLVKVFDDPIAWQIQRGLVCCYFRAKAAQDDPLTQARLTHAEAERYANEGMRLTLAHLFGDRYNHRIKTLTELDQVLVDGMQIRGHCGPEVQAQCAYWGLSQAGPTRFDAIERAKWRQSATPDEIHAEIQWLLRAIKNQANRGMIRVR